MEMRRTLPPKLMSSQDALSILVLVNNYNFCVLQRESDNYYCLPNVELVEGEESMLGCNYFATVQDMWLAQ